MGTFGVNGAEGRSNKHVFSATYHRETIATASRHDMGDAQGGRNVGSGGKKVRYNLHREMTGNCGVVGCFATNI